MTLRLGAWGNFAVCLSYMTTGGRSGLCEGGGVGPAGAQGQPQEAVAAHWHWGDHALFLLHWGTQLSILYLSYKIE